MDLVLRHWEPEHAQALCDAVGQSLSHLRPFIPFAAHEPKTLEERIAWIEGDRRGREAGGDLVYGMWLDGQIVGGCGLHRRVGEGGFEIGYWVHPDYLRRGIATEACRQLCAIAFAQPGIDRVEIHHDVANVASGRVAAAAGFEPAGERDGERIGTSDTGRVRIWRRTTPT